MAPSAAAVTTRASKGADDGGGSSAAVLPRAASTAPLDAFANALSQVASGPRTSGYRASKGPTSVTRPRAVSSKTRSHKTREVTVPWSSAACERASAASRRFSYRARRERRSARSGFASDSFPHAAAILSAVARSPASSAASIATRSLQGASSSDIPQTRPAFHGGFARQHVTGEGERRERWLSARILGQGLERPREPVRVGALVRRRSPDDRDVRRGRVELLGRLERLVEPAGVERDPRSECARRFVHRRELECGQRPLARELLVAEGERDCSEPDRGAGRVGHREPLPDLASRGVDIVPVERSQRRRGVRNELEPCREIGLSLGDVVDLGRHRRHLAHRVAAPRKGDQCHGLGAIGKLAAQSPRELHGLIGLAFERFGSREAEPRDHEIRVEARGGGISLPCARVACAFEGRPRDLLVPGVAVRRRIPARQDGGGAGRIALEEKRRDTCECVLLFRNADVFGAGHGVFERDVFAALDQTDERPLPGPIERGAGATRLELERPCQIRLDAGQAVDLCGVKLHFDARENTLGLEMILGPLVPVERVNAHAGGEKEHHTGDERRCALAPRPGHGAVPGAHGARHLRFEDTRQRQGIHDVARVRNDDVARRKAGRGRRREHGCMEPVGTGGRR